MGPLEASRSRRKSSKRGGKARKATEKPPMGPRMSYWAHAARPPIGVFCHPASKTAQPPLPANKSLLTLRAFNRYPPPRVKSVKHSVLLPEGNREHSQPSFASPSSNTPQNTATTWHYGFFIKPQFPCRHTPLLWTIYAWGDRMMAVQGDRPCTRPGLQSIRRGRNVPTRS